MIFENIISKIRGLNEKHDLYYVRYIDAKNGMRKLEKQVSLQNIECEALRKQVSDLKSELAIKSAQCIIQREVEDKLDMELSEKNTEIENLRKSCHYMQIANDKLQKEIKDYVIGMAEIRNLKIELEEQNRLLKSEIEDYKLKKEGLVINEASYLRIKKAEYKENDIDRLINRLDKLEELISNNNANNVFNISIAKADQLVGLSESGSQIIHTNKR